MIDYSPVLLSITSDRDLAQFIDSCKTAPRLTDIYDALASEYFFTTHPKYYFESDSQKEKRWSSQLSKNPSTNIFSQGSWIYHPWDNNLYHLIDKSEYYGLRTIRHRNILQPITQEKLRKATVAIAGLSVGLNILHAFIRYGIGETYRIADPDTFSLSNVNRALYMLDDFGQFKCDVARKVAHQIDPYLHVQTYQEGLDPDSLPSFLHGASLIVDAFDRFDMKLALRHEAKKLKIPVLSGFDVEKGVLLIVERYDTETHLTTDLFLNHTDEQALTQSTLSPKERTELFITIIGKELHSANMLKSVRAVGKTLTGYPQLIVATLAAASCFTLAAEQILDGKSIGSYRSFLPLSQLIAPPAH